MTRPLLAIWGAGGQARVVADIVALNGRYEIAGFLDDINQERHGEAFCGRPILGGQEQLPHLLQTGVQNLIIAIGNNPARVRLGKLGKEIGFTLPSAVHPSAAIAQDCAIEEGTVIKAQVAIDPDVKVGSLVLIGAGATLGHGVRLGDGVRLAGGVNIAGETIVGDLTTIATGSNIRDRLTIGARSVIGVGSVVVDNIPSDVIAYGNPARVIRAVVG